MSKTYLATKSDVQTIETNVQNINTQINTPGTGLEARVQGVENKSSEIDQAKTDIQALDEQLNNETTGLVKAVTDLDNQINEADTGVIARLEDLEQGGTSTMKFRAHTPSGVYEDGEVVQLNGSLWKANSAIDGSTTPVPFAVGTTGQTWSPTSVHNFRSPVTVVASNNVQGKFDTGATGVAISSVLGNNGFGALFDYSRKRISIAASSAPSDPSSTDLIMLGDINGAASTVVRDNLSGNKLATSDGNGKLASSVLEYSATVLNPTTNNDYDLGTTEKYFRGGHFQYVNFMSAAGVNEGNLDADSGSLGLFGTTELALGRGNNVKDLTFTADGLTLYQNLTVRNGYKITFRDGDTSNPEEVSMKMDGNDLTFYGKVNTSAEVEVARLTYDGNLTVKGDVKAANLARTAAGSVRTSSSSYSTVCSVGSIAVECNGTGMRIAISDSTTHYVTWTRIQTSGITSGYNSFSQNLTFGRPSSDGGNQSYIIGVRGTSIGTVTISVRRESSTILSCQASISIQ